MDHRASNQTPLPDVAEVDGTIGGGTCLWAANNTGLLCQTSTGTPGQWVSTNPAGGPTRTITINLRPLAWLP